MLLFDFHDERGLAGFQAGHSHTQHEMKRRDLYLCPPLAPGLGERLYISGRHALLEVQCMLHTVLLAMGAVLNSRCHYKGALLDEKGQRSPELEGKQDTTRLQRRKEASLDVFWHFFSC